MTTRADLVVRETLEGAEIVPIAQAEHPADTKLTEVELSSARRSLRRPVRTAAAASLQAASSVAWRGRSRWSAHPV
jgi:hypothetical protein